MHHFSEWTVETPGRKLLDITTDVQRAVEQAQTTEGLCTVFVHHTSASLIICENADPTVQGDMERFLSQLVPDGDPMYHHRAEGPDDMPAHIRTVLTQTSISIPVIQGRCALGTWQGIFLWEHRHASHRRRLSVTVTS